MYELRYQTPTVWTDTVLKNFNCFLTDHAAAERKAQGMAMSMVAHYRDKFDIVEAMTDIAVEELAHFREVMKLLLARGVVMPADEKDPYVNQLRALIDSKSEAFLLDRLLLGSIIEKRGHERFAMVAEAVVEDDLKRFYHAIAKSEARHFEVFLELARNHYPETQLQARLDVLLDHEARIVESLPIRAYLH